MGTVALTLGAYSHSLLIILSLLCGRPKPHYGYCGCPSVCLCVCLSRAQKQKGVEKDCRSMYVRWPVSTNSSGVAYNSLPDFLSIHSTVDIILLQLSLLPSAGTGATKLQDSSGQVLYHAGQLSLLPSAETGALSVRSHP